METPVEQVSRTVTVTCEGGLGSEVYGRVAQPAMNGEVVLVQPAAPEKPLTDWETLVMPCGD